MTGATRPRAGRPEADGATAIRVSVREIREVPLRALRACGLSSGEAECAADIVATAEIHERTGLASLAIETTRVPAGRVGMRLERCEGYAVVHDPAARGWLQAFVPACETAVVAGALVVPGLAAARVLDWAALDVAERAGRVLSLSDGVRRTVVNPEGKLLRSDAADEPRPPVAGLTIRPLAGVPADTGTLISTAAERKLRRREAVEDGVAVDAPLWTHACSLARGFLIPDHREGR